MVNETDTIAAQATPPGRGGIGVIRVSGPAAPQIAIAVLGRLPAPRHADYLPFRDPDGALIDQGIALYFPAPHSFTGESILELQAHGGAQVMAMLLEAVLSCGARLAQPGEFTLRAYLNGKIDLAQAEAIADLINASSRQAAQSALRSLSGEFSRRITAITERLIKLRMYVESAIDFSDQDIDFLAEGKIHEQVQQLLAEIRDTHRRATQGYLLREGMTVVIAGPPNAGKSSLLNRLAGKDAAIVTDIAGTTRDVLREQILLDGMPLHIVDTAGLRDSMDPVERIGIERAHAEITRADRVLLLIDDAGDDEQQLASLYARLPPAIPVTIVRNKIDITGRAPVLIQGPYGAELGLSVTQGLGIDLLSRHLQQCAGFDNRAGEGAFTARRRHLDSLVRAEQALEQGLRQLSDHNAGDLLAEECRCAQQALAEITGEFTSDDLLGQIFASFCVGK
ncbi:MAG: tRNA uridine-5-carboxymethylaminomethyl(34) synthesis GTPase MnmE [Gammaproteobacteria bacterium]|nr:tRNA uridine-5-carboxymethylaminomethyl(34) synthesis GTPase MnmE [Gammaproteobacteria bacterium]